MRCLDDRRLDAYVAKVLPNLGQLSVLLSVVIIDVVLAGDNAIVVGMAAAGLPVERRRRVIGLGILAATVLRIALASVAAKLLAIIGLTLAGGVLLLWVSWKMYRELCATQDSEQRARQAGHCGGSAPRTKTTAQAMTQIVLADLSMSIDNVLAVAGTAHAHPWILILGLVLSVAMMGVASTYIARLLGRHFWISWVGLGIITIVALKMVWAGSTQILLQSSALRSMGL